MLCTKPSAPVCNVRRTPKYSQAVPARWELSEEWPEALLLYRQSSSHWKNGWVQNWPILCGVTPANPVRAAYLSLSRTLQLPLHNKSWQNQTKKKKIQHTCITIVVPILVLKCFPHLNETPTVKKCLTADSVQKLTTESEVMALM